MSRAVIQDSFGGPEVLELREVDEPRAGDRQVRVRVAAAGLNPVDWIVASSPEAATAFGVTLPSGFGNDYAGTIDEVGSGVSGFAVGDRVYGGARGHAVADYVIVDPTVDELRHTPGGLDDATAATLHIAGCTQMHCRPNVSAKSRSLWTCVRACSRTTQLTPRPGGLHSRSA